MVFTFVRNRPIISLLCATAMLGIFTLRHNRLDSTTVSEAQIVSILRDHYPDMQRHGNRGTQSVFINPRASNTTETTIQVPPLHIKFLPWVFQRGFTIALDPYRRSSRQPGWQCTSPEFSDELTYRLLVHLASREENLHIPVACGNVGNRQHYVLTIYSRDPAVDKAIIGLDNGWEATRTFHIVVPVDKRDSWILHDPATQTCTAIEARLLDNNPAQVTEILTRFIADAFPEEALMALRSNSPPTEILNALESLRRELFAAHESGTIPN